MLGRENISKKSKQIQKSNELKKMDTKQQTQDKLMK